MAAAAVFLALGVTAALAADGAARAAITGHIRCPEGTVLPPDAVAHVRLEVAAAPERPALRVAEVVVPAAGKPAAIPFELEYEAARIRPEKRYLVRATISAGEKLLFVSRAPYPVITHGSPVKVEILVEPAGVRRIRASVPSGEGALGGKEWRLAVPGGEAGPHSAAAGGPTLTFDLRGKRISGSTGCNRFFGSYSTGADATIRLDPSGSTMMACSEELTRAEKAFLEALRATTGYRIEGSSLELLAGDRVVARLEPSDSGIPPSD